MVARHLDSLNFVYWMTGKIIVTSTLVLDFQNVSKILIMLWLLALSFDVTTCLLEYHEILQ